MSSWACDMESLFYFMKNIHCENIYYDKEGKKKKCNRFLAALTDLQIDILRVDEETPVFRCPRCSRETRWSTIYFDKEKGGLSMSSLDIQPEFEKKSDMQYVEVKSKEIEEW